GFQDFTGSQPTELKFYPLSNQTIVLTPGFLGAEYKEYFKVYIDFNQDGDFFDDGELAFDPGFAQHGVVSGELSTPAFTQGGLTRMRVMMKYGENNQPAPTACESFTYGQIEDYCATLLTSGSPTSDNFESKTKLRIYPQPAQNWVWADLPGVQIEENATIHLFDLSGKMVLEIKTLPLRKQAFYISTEDIPPGVYLITLQMDNQIFRGKLIKE
ncbi:MAG: T9SS type A sorting domain-containing protein, partial [Saprospiraceae bacterium]|nr:T9SS type A sorting domain-containing protein [Saprospiraceae bacterium]